MVFDRKAYWKEYREKNKEKIRKKKNKYMKKYRQRSKVKKRMKEYNKKYSQHPRMKKRRREYYRKYKPKYVKTKKKTDLNYSLICKLRKSLTRAFKYFSKTGKIRSSHEYEINYKAIIEHLKPFPKDIKNYHVDHIIPLSLFDFNNPRHIKKAFLPQNHQWLPIKQNLEKGNKLIMPN